MSDTIGIDLGTTTLKVARLDSCGRLIVSCARHYHEPHEHEVDFDRVFGVLADAMRELMAGTRERPAVVGVGLSSQTNSFALLDEDGACLTPVYLWTGDWAGDEAVALEQRLAFY